MLLFFKDIISQLLSHQVGVRQIYWQMTNLTQGRPPFNLKGGRVGCESPTQEDWVMHQSLFPQCPSPRATAGHLLTLSVPGVGHSQFYRGPGAGHLRNPGRPPDIWNTRVFESPVDEFSGKDEAFGEQWLVRQGLEKLVDVFWIFLHLLEIFNVKNEI